MMGVSHTIWSGLITSTERRSRCFLAGLRRSTEHLPVDHEALGTPPNVSPRRPGPQ